MNDLSKILFKTVLNVYSVYTDGIPIQSPVNGKEITYFPELAKFKRTKLALTAIVMMIDGVLSIVGGIYYFQYFLDQPYNRR
jgi:hypothetical protein